METSQHAIGNLQAIWAYVKEGNSPAFPNNVYSDVKAKLCSQ